MKKYLPFVLLILIAACGEHDKNPDSETDLPPAPPPTPVVKVNALNIIPHDPTSYTEGLQVYNGKLYEGAGDYENSALQIADLKTGKVLQQHKMGKAESDGGGIFGEGINVFKGKIYQLTWRSHIVYVYDEKDITKPIKTFVWPYEGWGMTNDGTNLIISDGGATGHLYFVNPDNFSVVKTLSVQDNRGPVTYVNELEYINGFIYANVFTTDKILKIDAATGKVVLVIDCTGLINDNEVPDRQDNVLNGIAYDSSTKKMYITGKRWPKMFEVSVN